MIRRPPRSTLFPTRRSSDLSRPPAPPPRRFPPTPAAPRGGRSEEHTSELQSRSDLVCRLLLEKKKTQGNLSSTQINELTSPTISRRRADRYQSYYSTIYTLC